ncbi:AAA family ATPase [Oceanobacillus sojae]|uniref:AAA family ATPase n=1 Tax=Oceanobacillus sojae TaxID=582851 RepID=UPI003636B3FE
MNKPYIIVVGGVSGSGKTTVSKHLSSKLGNAKAIFFDDYDFDGPSNIIDWVERGADYDEWDLDLLLKDLEVFRSDSVRYIVIDFPFAYQHAQIKEWINFAVFIDTPLDIAYARRLVRDFQDSTAKNILLDAKNYLSTGRNGYLEMLQSIKPSSDLVIDGTLPVSKITDIILKTMSKSYS